MGYVRGMPIPRVLEASEAFNCAAGIEFCHLYGTKKGGKVPLIIASWDEQPIGIRQVGTWHFPEGERVQPYVPVRQATHEEWMSEQREVFGHAIPDDHERATYYYEISTD